MPSNRASVGSDGRKDRLAGKTISDRYVIESLIARGGMAAVYRAHQVKLNRRIAIKILRPPPDSDENASFHERFRLEAETLAQLNHPNIVTVYDHGDFDDDQVFLAMEFVDGNRLTDLLRDGPMTVERTLHLLLQVCEALRYAHRRGVVHRDLKPSNLLITETDDGDELVKVVDFGLVKLTEVDVTITSNGLILGSPHCMAPEQVRGQTVDGRTDIYAMGVLLFRCLTGTYPFHGNNSTATMIAHLNQPTPTFFSVSPDLEVPDGLENVVRRCLAKNPRDRFQTMEELQEAIAFFLNVSPDQYRTVSRSQVTLERFVPEARSSSPARWALLGGGAVVALTAILCAGVVAGSFLVPTGPSGTSIPIEPLDDQVHAGAATTSGQAGDDAGSADDVEAGGEDAQEPDTRVAADEGQGGTDEGGQGEEAGGSTSGDEGTASTGTATGRQAGTQSGGRAGRTSGSTQARQGSTGGTGTETKASGGQNTAERNPTSGTGGTGTAAKTDPAGTGAGTTAATGNKQADGAEDTDGWMEWDDMQ